MPSIQETDLKKQMKTKSFSNLYLLYGDEKYLVKHYTEQLTAKIVSPDFKDFNFHEFNGKSFDFDEFSNAVEALPMMSEYVCILIKDLPIDNLNADINDKLLTLFSDIPESTVVVISLLCIGANTKSAKGKKFLSAVEEYGSAVQFNHAGIQQLTKLIEKGAEQRNCVFSSSDASYLISLIGDDMSVVLNELEKICAYKKEGKISRSDIDAVVVKNMQARAFDLTKAIIANNCDNAMDILDTLLSMKEEPISILGAIITPYVDMYRAKTYISGGFRAEDAGKDYNYKNKEFRLTNAAKTASKYSVKQLRQFLEVLNDADTMLKSSPINQRLILEQTITKLLLVSNGEKI